MVGENFFGDPALNLAKRAVELDGSSCHPRRKKNASGVRNSIHVSAAELQ
jgi:hypothetical protein